MAKYKPIHESKVDRFISAIFRALGSASRPFFIASLIKKIKILLNFGNKVRKIEKILMII